MAKSLSAKLTLLLLLMMSLSITAAVSAASQVSQADEDGPLATVQPYEQNIAGESDVFPFPPLVGGAPIRPQPDSGRPPVAGDPGTLYQSAVNTPAITLWYTDNQTFGQIGDPQKWVNIVGNVSSAIPLNTLSYTLNGGTPRVVSVGPNGSRLEYKGDFNIDIDYTDLAIGNNTVAITALDNNNGQTTANVAVNYQPFAGTWTPQTYTTDFGSATQITEVAQVVDGKWIIDAGQARPAAGATGFDRLLAIGDMSWREYTVTVPVTVHSRNVNINHGIGLIVRWLGHYEDPPGSLTQPYVGWRRLGAMAWIRYDKSTSTEGLQLLGDGGRVLGTKPFNLTNGVQYIFKVKITPDVDANQPATYSFKVWPAAESEPQTWDIVSKGRVGEPRNGSILLVAHYADVSFGNVVVDLVNTQPQPVLTWETSGTGSGVVSRDPAKTSYRFGEDVTVTATADPGSSFEEWEGDLSGSSPTGTLEMFADRSVTAVFSGNAQICNLTVLTTGLGTVDLDPDRTSFTCGMEVALEATPATGYQFESWTGDLSGSETTKTLVMDTDKTVTANFAPVQMCALTVNQPEHGQIVLNPPGGAYPCGTNVELEAIPETGFKFDSWGGALTGTLLPEANLLMDTDKTVTATFVPIEYTVMIAFASNEGNVTKSPDQPFYYYGDMVTLTAEPKLGYRFAGWTGNITPSTELSIVVMVDQDLEITANFESLPIHTLNLTLNGNGTVTKDPSKNGFIEGETVTLTAIPGPHATFTGWSGDFSGSNNPLVVVMDDDKDIIANFADDLFSLTVTHSTGGGVTVTPLKAQYTYGDQVSLQAIPNTGYTFDGWTGDATGTTNPYMLTIEGNMSVDAAFNLIPPIPTYTLFVPMTASGN